MNSLITGSVRRKVILVVLATTFTALLLVGAALVIYDLRSYADDRVTDIQSLANIISRTAAPAISFDDVQNARESLALLKVQPKIMGAAIYKPNGSLFASYSNSSEKLAFPRIPNGDGYSIQGNRILYFQRIIENNEVIGTLHLSGLYDPLSRLKDYLAIMAAVMLAAMAVAAFVSAWLQKAITRPILDVTQVTREVMDKRDFSLRADKTSNDEIGELVDAFNGMLTEIGLRSSAMEIVNFSLKQEMREKREAEQALQDAARHKDEFLATLAHELRNPLAPLRNGLEILSRPGTDAATLLHAREMMERQLRLMVRLVDDLLDVSRITTGKLVIKKERVSLQTVVAIARETVAPYVEARQHVLNVEVPAEPIILYADASRLAQSLSNLLSNAARYTEPGGVIDLKVGLHDNNIEISVIDNGIGIAPELHGSIFQMFTQADHSLERKQSGLGVGLALTKKLVELHGGSIAIKSAGLGQGSQFIVTLPRSDDIPAEATTQTAERDAPLSAQRILLADDNVDFATSLATLLTTMGHEVRVAHNGVEALKIAGEFHPDYAFLDIGMPMMNGYDLAKRLKKSPATARTILTAVSGWGQESDRLRASESGFDHHLVKPVEIEQLEAIMAS